MPTAILATPDTLSALMDFDHVILVNDDGTIDDHDLGLYAPDVSNDDEHDALVNWQPYDQTTDGWTLLTGYTGQDRYNGPVMHPSEYIGGGMARDILATPGYYVVVEVRDELGDFPDSPIGWAVAHKPLEA